MSGKDDKVFDYAKKARGITATELKQTVVIVISNYVQYAGTTYSYSDGRSIAYIALSSGTSQLTRFGNVVVHEAGGHGFGRLADEYYNSNSGNINNDPDALLEIIEWQDRGYDQNDLADSTAQQMSVEFYFHPSPIPERLQHRIDHRRRRLVRRGSVAPRTDQLHE